MKRTLLIAFIGIVILFVATNPSTSAFKDHLGKTSYEGLIREHNFFIYSTYKDNSYNEEEDVHADVVYVGLLGNFWKVGKEKKIVADIIIQDTISRHTKLTITEFANRIKKKYPEYSQLGNKELTDKILAKYPQYKERVDLASN